MTASIDERLQSVLDRLAPELVPASKPFPVWPGRFEGRTALLTGAGGGIGMVAARRLGREGAQVILLDRSAAALRPVADDLAREGIRAVSVVADLTDIVATRTAVDAVIERVGEIDLLVNSAGVTEQVPWDELRPEQWDRMLDVNLRGTFFLTQHIAERMRRRGFGRIVSISSGAAKLGRPNGVHYAVSKAGVLSFTRSLADGLAGSGVRVNALCPGGVITEMAVQPDGWGLPGGRAATAVRTGRPMHPEEIAGLIAFLLSDEAEYVHGQAINADDGTNVVS